jgi:hypothetical protein
LIRVCDDVIWVRRGDGKHPDWENSIHVDEAVISIRETTWQLH